MEHLRRETERPANYYGQESPAPFAYIFQGSATDGDLDKQGRTLIPSVLREFAHLDKEVVFIGMGKRAEIWDKARWDEKNAEVELSIEDIASDMEASGFSI